MDRIWFGILDMLEGVQVINYSEEHIKRAKEELLRQFDLMVCQEFGKLTCNFNRTAKIVEIVPEPHIRIKENSGDLTGEKIEV